MYCIRKCSDGWAVFNVDSDESRKLTDEEVEVLKKEIPALADHGTAAWYGDNLECIDDKP